VCGLSQRQHVCHEEQQHRVTEHEAHVPVYERKEHKIHKILFYYFFDPITLFYYVPLEAACRTLMFYVNMQVIFVIMTR